MAGTLTLTNLTASANAFADENMAVSKTVHFFNAAIGEINAYLKAVLPLIDTSDSAYATTAYAALDDEWLMSVLVPYIAYGIKMNDSSSNEADRFHVKYLDGLRILRTNKKTAIATAYQGENFAGAYLITHYTGWF